MRCSIAKLFSIVLFFWSLLSAQAPADSKLPILDGDVILNDMSKEKSIDQQLYSIMTSKVATSVVTGSVKIPVVVHIIHDNGSENISDAQVENAITELNEGFHNSPLFNAPNGVDMEIEFCLAKQDPFGNSTTGINRVQSPLTSMTMETQDLALKNLIQWDPLHYINIWVVKSVSSTSMGDGLSGYATPPASHGLPNDGIVVEANTFGTSLEQIRIAIHLMGHYLGLYHTFEGGCKNDNCLLDGDHVADTPPDGTTQYVPCSQQINSCSSDTDDHSVNNPFRPVSLGGLGDQPDLNNNFMDINYLTCLNSFTQGQKNRVKTILQTSRSSLLNAGGCNIVCPVAMNAFFTVPSTDVDLNSAITFTNTSTPSSDIQYEWYINDSLVSSGKDLTYTFPNEREYVVKLVIKISRIVSCVSSYSKTINVTNPLHPDFTLTAGTFIRPGTTVSTNDRSSGRHTSSTWLIDNVVISQSFAGISYTFNTPGLHMISLEISNGLVSKRKDVQIEVNNCSQISKRANTWYFGLYGGISFASGIATPLTDTDSYSHEACSSISDADGNYLFSVLPAVSSDSAFSTYIKNKNHQIMPNGSAIAGGYSTSQCAIVPQPGNPNLYYVFTMADFASGGLYYSIIDMSKDNGNGDVILKNIKLQDYSTEKITVTPHVNGKDYWVITHPWNSGNFYVYLINQSGINTTPVISTAGTPLMGQTKGAIGIMKISPDNRYLAMSATYDTGSFVEVYDFNPANGHISNFLKIDDIPYAYGIEFSPDASKLYVTGGWYPQIGGLYQYDMTGRTSHDVLSSKCLIYTLNNYGQLQLAPDGRIYFARAQSRYMGLIQNPNASGVNCDFDDNGFLLALNTHVYLGLPSIIPGFVVPNPIKIAGPREACPSASGIVYKLNNPLPSGATISWSCSGNISISSQNDTSARVNFSTAGTAKLIAMINLSCGTYYDTSNINVRAPSVNLGPDRIMCEGSSYLLDAGAGFLSYRWQDGSTSQTYRVLHSGTYYVQVTSCGGCTASDTIVFTPARSANTLDLGTDRVICPSSVLVLDAGAGFKSYRWQDGSTNQSFTAFSNNGTPGQTKTFSVTVTDMCDNTKTDEIHITFDNPPVSAGPDVTICNGESVTLSGTGTGSLKWFNASGIQISSTQTVTVNPSASTFYVFTAESNGCRGIDTVNVTVDNLCNNCSVNAGPDISISKGQTATLQATTSGNCIHNGCTSGSSPFSCTSAYAITLVGSTDTEILTGQTACVPKNSTYTGSVSVRGGTLIICGTANSPSICVESGLVVVNGTLHTSWLNTKGRIENYGNILVNNDFNINAGGEFVNYGDCTVAANMTIDNICRSYSQIRCDGSILVNGNGNFRNECTIAIQNYLHINGAFNNSGYVSVMKTTYLNSGSQFSANDGSILTTDSIYFNSIVYGGTAGYSSINVNQKTCINSGTNIRGLIDICDHNGIEVNYGNFANTVTTDCRTVSDGSTGVTAYIWSDSNGTIVGYGKVAYVKPTATTTYTITVIDDSGNRHTDQVKVSVTN